MFFFVVAIWRQKQTPTLKMQSIKKLRTDSSTSFLEDILKQSCGCTKKGEEILKKRCGRICLQIFLWIASSGNVSSFSLQTQECVPWVGGLKVCMRSCCIQHTSDEIPFPEITLLRASRPTPLSSFCWPQPSRGFLNSSALRFGVCVCVFNTSPLGCSCCYPRG